MTSCGDACRGQTASGPLSMSVIAIARVDSGFREI